LIRDEELSRLIKYAQGMGLSVRFKPFIKGGSHAEWTTDGTEVTVFVQNGCTKLDKVLSLIHELGHQKAFIDNERSISQKEDVALGKDIHNKAHRKIILDMELNASLYWEIIYRDTNCKFGLDKLEVQRQRDVWVYEYYYETGEWPTLKASVAKKRELKKKACI